MPWLDLKHECVNHGSSPKAKYVAMSIVNL